MPIQHVRKYTESLYTSINEMMPQLSSSTPSISREKLKELLQQQCLHVFIFTDTTDANEPARGMLSLVLFDIPTGKRAWIEDVVVHENARGRGIGKQLVNAAITYAQEQGAKSIDLTSRPTRIAANKLYQKAGFVQRETNVYRFQPSN
ncbi:MAG: GNAT family N-acetyltransferase [Actinomycetaceae bacterium]|nr:GNAT family N-acetyltransferase [Actinomycetaceae bacterium]